MRTYRPWFFLFGLIYFAQGSVMAYITNFQKPYLSSIGIEATTLGLFTSLLLLPFVLKIVFGLMSDRYPIAEWGHRKPYIVIGLLIASFSFFGAALTDPAQSFFGFAACIFCASIGVALFDSCTDGLAIDTIDPEQHGSAQAYMVGGRAMGVVALSFVFSRMDLSSGYQTVFVVIALLLTLPLFWILPMKVSKLTRSHGSQKGLGTELNQPTTLGFLAYAWVYSFLLFGIDGMVTLRLSQNFGASPNLIGEYGSLRGVGSVAGAAFCGWFILSKGRLRAALTSVALLMMAGLGLVVAGSVGFYMSWAPIWGFAWGFQETVYVGLAMGFCPPRYAASAFAVFMAVSNLGTAVGEGVATGLVSQFSIPQIMLVGSLSFIVLPIFVRGFRRRIVSFDALETSERP
jgi:PAT family beta-lactamase induction signal transducer AmpG